MATIIHEYQTPPTDTTSTYLVLLLIAVIGVAIYLVAVFVFPRTNTQTVTVPSLTTPAVNNNAPTSDTLDPNNGGAIPVELKPGNPAAPNPY